MLYHKGRILLNTDERPASLPFRVVIVVPRLESEGQTDSLIHHAVIILMTVPGEHAVYIRTF